MLSGVGNNSTIQVVSRHLVNDTPFTTVHGTVVNGTLVSHISQKGRKCWPLTQRERPTGMRQPAASCSSGPAENGARVPRALPRTGRCSGCPSATMEAAQPCAPFHHRRRAWYGGGCRRGRALNAGRGLLLCCHSLCRVLTLTASKIKR